MFALADIASLAGIADLPGIADLAGIADLEWARPGGLWALALPVIVLLLVRLLARPAAQFTGTLALWSRLEQASIARGARSHRRIPPAVWLLALALSFGALALAGPRLPSEKEQRVWYVIVDRSPSMYLPSEGGTRIVRALTLARDALQRLVLAGDRVQWIAPNGTAGEIVIAREPPEEWLRAPHLPRPEPGWSDQDREGVLWVTDRAPTRLPRHAGLLASGGAAVPGPVSAQGTTRFDWNGEALVEVPGGAPARRVARTGTPPPILASMLDTWATARGWSLDPASSSEIGLEVRTIRTAAGAEKQAIDAGRDGWSARGEMTSTASSGDAEGALELWLAARVAGDPSRRLALVTFGPGRIESAWSAMEDPRGDPAAFAVSWAELFDRAALPASGVVELSERLDAGAPQVIEPRASISLEDRERRALATWDAALALLACILSVAALLWGRRVSAP